MALAAARFGEQILIQWTARTKAAVPQLPVIVSQVRQVLHPFRMMPYPRSGVEGAASLDRLTEEHNLLGSDIQPTLQQKGNHFHISVKPVVICTSLDHRIINWRYSP